MYVLGTCSFVLCYVPLVGFAGLGQGKCHLAIFSLLPSSWDSLAAFSFRCGKGREKETSKIRCTLMKDYCTS